MGYMNAQSIIQQFNLGINMFNNIYLQILTSLLLTQDDEHLVTNNSILDTATEEEKLILSNVLIKYREILENEIFSEPTDKESLPSWGEYLPALELTNYHGFSDLGVYIKDKVVIPKPHKNFNIKNTHKSLKHCVSIRPKQSVNRGK